MRHNSLFFVIFSYFCIGKLENRYEIPLPTIKNNLLKDKRTMEKASLIYAILSKYKYLITIVIGLFVVCFADSNSFYRRMVLHYEIMELKSEIEYYNNVYESIPDQEFIEVRGEYIIDTDGTPIKNTGEKLEIKIENGLFIINFPIYIIENDKNYGFKIAYPLVK